MSDFSYRPSPILPPETSAVEPMEFTARQSMPLDTPYQRGHYPGNPIYPGVFFIESVVLAARSVLGHGDGDTDLVGIPKVRFRSPGTPGLEFTVTARVTPESAVRWLVKARCHQEDTTLATMTLHVGDLTDEGA